MESKTFLFDIGNVLLAFDFEPALNSLRGPDADPKALEKIIAAKDPFEAGQTPLEDYLKHTYALLDYNGDDEHFFSTWNSIFTPIKPTWELAKELHEQGHRLILFSNTNPIHAPYCLKSYPVFEYFHHAHFSHEAGAIKPHQDFYTTALETYQLDPANTFYIDDLPANIIAGDEHGFQTFTYHPDQHQDLIAAIKTFLT